jgi:ribonuclease BN (tRNA processing enzyme)
LLIAGPPGTKARLDSLLEVFFPKSTGSKWKFPWSVQEIAVGAPDTVLEHSIVTAEVIHQSGAPSTALRLSDGTTTFAYSGDTEWTDALLPIAKDADLFICECYAYAGRITGHITWETLKPRLADLRAREIMLTHMNPTMLAKLDDVRQSGVQVAEDGVVLDF